MLFFPFGISCIFAAKYFTIVKLISFSEYFSLVVRLIGKPEL
jgi:hypothetical protein